MQVLEFPLQILLGTCYQPKFAENRIRFSQLSGRFKSVIQRLGGLQGARGRLVRRVHTLLFRHLGLWEGLEGWEVHRFFGRGVGLLLGLLLGGRYLLYRLQMLVE